MAWSGADLKMVKLSCLCPLTLLSSHLILILRMIFPNLFEKISSPKDTETYVESPISISPSSSVGSSSPVKSTTPPPGYSFNELFNSVKISLWIIPLPLGSELIPEEPNDSDACKSIHLYK
ncbi:hypothetical protein Tco_0553262 [Tanacetum coccineum]